MSLPWQQPQSAQHHITTESEWSRPPPSSLVPFCTLTDTDTPNPKHSRLMCLWLSLGALSYILAWTLGPIHIENTHIKSERLGRTSSSMAGLVLSLAGPLSSCSKGLTTFLGSEAPGAPLP
jgi:hypothetical protein